MRGRLLVLVGILALPVAARAGTITYRFGNITANNPTDAAIGEAQLFMDVVSVSNPKQVLFVFRNVGPLQSSITRVYFEDGALLGIAAIDDSDPGVSFSAGVKPNNLPGGQELDPPFRATAEFSSGANPPRFHEGVNPGESLGVLFDLEDGFGYNDVIAAINRGFSAPSPGELPPTLRVGVHVQGFESGGSESFVVIPEPATLALLGAGAAVAAGLAARRRRNASSLDS